MAFFKALFLFLDDFLYKGYIDEEYESDYDSDGDGYCHDKTGIDVA